MDPNTIVNLSLAGLNAILSIINEVRGQGGMTDDQILAAAQTQLGANAQFIQKWLAELEPPTAS